MYSLSRSIELYECGDQCFHFQGNFLFFWRTKSKEFWTPQGIFNEFQKFKEFQGNLKKEKEIIQKFMEFKEIWVKYKEIESNSRKITIPEALARSHILVINFLLLNSWENTSKLTCIIKQNQCSWHLVMHVKSQYMLTCYTNQDKLGWEFKEISQNLRKFGSSKKEFRFQASCGSTGGDLSHRMGIPRRAISCMQT